MALETYTFQNIYLITTYRCNWSCNFCLFKFNKEKEAPINEIIDKLEYSILDSNRPVYIKITGGEPFIRPNLLKAIFSLCRKHHDKIYKVGIGTNGSIQLRKFFNDVTTRTHIFLSRHNMNDNLLKPVELARNVNNPLIDFRINCNLIKGAIDSPQKIQEYIENKTASYGITNFCFRELSKVDIDKNQIYPKQIYDYIKYYGTHLVPVHKIEKQLEKFSRFSKSRITGNYYDTNNWYWYDNGSNKHISVKFRTIDETRLIDFNAENPNEVDEYVIHPDGTLTGCWDKDLKIIMEGGTYHAEQALHSKTKEEIS